MKKISLIQQKGGCGKTTVCVHLAAELKSIFPDLKIAIADADPQKSATRWILRNKDPKIKVYTVGSDGLGKNLKRELSEIDADITLIDLPPSVDSISLRAALASDLMLVPIGPTAVDIDAAKAALDICQDAVELDSRKKYLMVPTRIQSSTSEYKELYPLLESWGPVSKSSLGMRVSFSRSYLAGEGIGDFDKGSKGHKEIRDLANEVIKILEVA